MSFNVTSNSLFSGYTYLYDHNLSSYETFTFQGSKFRFTKKSGGESSGEENRSLTKRARIKNAKRIKNAVDSRNCYQKAKFPSRGLQGTEKVRTSNSGDELSSLKANNDKKQNDSKEGSPSVKRSQRIKIKREKEDLEDQVSETSSISEVSSLSSDVSKKRTPLPAIKYVFKSRRLQELQEKMESETVEDALEEKDNLGDISKENNEWKVRTDSESERSSRSSSRRQSREEERVHLNSEDERQNHETPLAEKKRKISAKKTPASRLQALKNDSEMPSLSDDDEESNKPLSELKESIKKTNEETTERVVKKVIKVVKKIKTKSGETKTKVVKIIKKMGIRKKSKGKCAVISGRRRVRCGQCKGCRVKDDCGVCKWCE